MPKQHGRGALAGAAEATSKITGRRFSAARTASKQLRVDYPDALDHAIVGKNAAR